MNCCACGKELLAESSWYDEFAETATCHACLGSASELTVRLGRTQSVLKQMGDKWFAEKARAEKAEARVKELEARFAQSLPPPDVEALRDWIKHIEARSAKLEAVAEAARDTRDGTGLPNALRNALDALDGKEETSTP